MAARNKVAYREGQRVRAAIERVLRDDAARHPLARPLTWGKINQLLAPELRRSEAQIGEHLRRIHREHARE